MPLSVSLAAELLDYMVLGCWFSSVDLWASARTERDRAHPSSSSCLRGTEVAAALQAPAAELVIELGCDESKSLLPGGLAVGTACSSRDQQGVTGLCAQQDVTSQQPWLASHTTREQRA